LNYGFLPADPANPKRAQLRWSGKRTILMLGGEMHRSNTRFCTLFARLLPTGCLNQGVDFASERGTFVNVNTASELEYLAGVDHPTSPA
jgi:hypothetical protein